MEEANTKERDDTESTPLLTSANKHESNIQNHHNRKCPGSTPKLHVCNDLVSTICIVYYRQSVTYKLHIHKNMVQKQLFYKDANNLCGVIGGYWWTPESKC